MQTQLDILYNKEYLIQWVWHMCAHIKQPANTDVIRPSASISMIEIIFHARVVAIERVKSSTGRSVVLREEAKVPLNTHM